MKLRGGDGAVQLCFPVFAVHVADYPEQCLVTCTRYGQCPICECPANQLGQYTDSPLRKQKDTLKAIADAAAAATKAAANRILQALGTTFTLDPWWGELPHVNNQAVSLPTYFTSCTKVSSST